MLNDLPAPIEHEEEIEELRLEDEMPMNVGVEIDGDRTNNIFQDLLNEARNELYPGCSEFLSLNFLVKLMHVKVLNGWSNKSFDMLLELLRATFPMCSTTIPSSFYEAKRKLRDLCLGYETIHACKYDYRGGSTLILNFPDFACDPRNVRLSLASDRFNLFGQMTIMSSSYPRNNFMETDAIFLEFEDDLYNIAGGSSSVDDNTTRSSSQQPATPTPTPRRRAQSRLLELECHVAINERISMAITHGAEKPISLHAVRFNQAIGQLFVLDFNDQVMNRFVEHQMLTTFKEFRIDCHRHFKKYSDPEEARANPPNTLVGRHEDCHFLCDHYISRAF
ncbi:CACTA en-spm transposon protein [Cucumis melo var. makuwa]|nr:CACTA en-spm transposon protein [Cucumis melo var. makuwa]